VAPSVVIETFSVPDQGDAVPPEISRVRLQLDFEYSNFRFSYR
jgi:hypothetical protein